MKFYCDSCQAKYSIADEKVRGKVLKVRCKKCSHIITVREPGTKEGGAGASAPSAPEPPRQSLQWHYSVNGQSFGPLGESELEQKFSSGELGDATYVWNETFTDWKPATSVEVFSRALDAGKTGGPGPNEKGITQAPESAQRGAASTESPPQDVGGAAVATQTEPRDQHDDRGARPARMGAEAEAGAESLQPEPASDELDSVSQRPEVEQQEESDEVREKPTPEARRPQREQAEEAREDESRKSRLENLRQRLGADEDDEESVEPEKTEGAKSADACAELADDTVDSSDALGGLDSLRNKLGSAGDEEQPEEEPAAAKPDAELAAEPDKDGPEPSVSAGEEAGGDESFEADASTPEPEEAEDDEALIGEELDAKPADTEHEVGDDAVHDGLFSGLDSDGDDNQAPPPEADEPASPPVDPGQLDDDQAEDAVPFFPDAPKLGESDESDDSASMSRVGEITDSLLIQIDEIKSDDRKRVVMGSIGAVAALIAVAGLVYLGWTQQGSDEPVEQDDGIRMDHVGAQPEFGEYSREELAQVSDHIVVEDEIAVTEEDAQAAYERDQAVERGEIPAEERSAGSDMPSVDPDSFDYDDPGEHLAEADAEEPDEAGASESRFARPEREEGGDDGEAESDGMAGLGDFGRGSNDRDPMAAIQSDRQRGIYDGDDNVDLEATQMREGLTSAQISEGLDRVMQSVGSCRQRHTLRGESLDADTLEVSLTVLPSGEVGQFEMKPDSLEDTVFARCMESHTNRWRYPRFKGDPVEIEAPFALQ